MNQHPIPQNISGYEFRLVGFMTLKQFFQLAGGLIIAAVFWRSPLPDIIRIPLSGFCALIGFLLAFVPVQGRPFSAWLLAFIKAVYSPTVFTWTPTSPTPTSPVTQTTPTLPLSSSSPLDKNESQLLSRFGQLFGTTLASHPTPPDSKLDVPIAPPIMSEFKKTAPSSQAKSPDLTSGTIYQPFAPLQVAVKQPTISTANPNPTPKTTSTLPLSSSPALDSAINPTPITPLTRQTVFDSSKVTATATPAPENLITPPTSPNIIAGVITTPTGKSVEGVILEIIDTRTEIPVRAFRTNRLGQFQTATPLPIGKYSVVCEKDDFTINPVSIEISGELIPPIIITAQPKS
jgi:hypothetical protein